jgi:hypothetical protein
MRVFRAVFIRFSIATNLTPIDKASGEKIATGITFPHTEVQAARIHTHAVSAGHAFRQIDFMGHSYYLSFDRCGCG